MSFQRGQDIKDVLDLGYKNALKSMGGCLVFTEKDIYQDINDKSFKIEDLKIENIRKQSTSLYMALVIIVITGDKFRILKNRVSDDSSTYSRDRFPEIVFRIKKAYDEWFAIRGISQL